MNKNRVHAALDGRSAANRLTIVAGVALLWAVAIFGRVAYLQLFRHSEYLARAHRQQQRTIEIAPKRGTIYDRNMHPLAMSVPVDSVFADPAEIADEPLASRLLSGALGIPADVIQERMESSRAFAWIERKITPEKKEAVAALNLKGIYFQQENQRFYPKRTLASHVLGFVDVDEKGLGGIEYELDKQIRGESEKIVVMSDARQRWFDGGEAQRQRGANVVLTLDEKIQYITERELDAAIAKTHAIAGTAMVMNPNTGEILALANWPQFNPNAASGAPAQARMDRAVSALYEPGSTFKLITLAAAFDQNITRPDEVFYCENGAIYVAGHRIRDHKPFGMLSVADILAQSSDVGAIKIAMRLGPPKFYDYIRAFGFGAPTGVDLPGESKGLLRPLENWTPISIGAISMGQEIGVTPVQLLSAVSAIANGGLLYRPHVVREIRRGDAARPAEDSAEQADAKRVIRPETAATLRRLMEGVVLHGTGSLARLDGWSAGGKTGSAQKIDPTTGRYSRTQLIASFSGFAPVSDPEITVLVSLDSPVGLHEGGQVAAPVFKRIAEQVLSYLQVPRDVPLNPKLIEAAYRKKQASDPSMLEESASMDFSDEPDLSPAASAQPLPKPLPDHIPEIAVAADADDDISVPDFAGKTMRDVTEICLRAGLDPVLVGSGLATEQSPAAGLKVKRGAKVAVQFGVISQKAGKARKASGK